MVNNYDKGKFRFSETFNNDSGKSSGSGMIGVLGGIVGLIGFLVCVVGYLFQIPNTLEMMTNVILLMGIVSTLLSVRKITAGLKKEDEV